MWMAGLAAMALVSSANAQSQPKPPVADADWVELTLVTDEPHLSLYAREPRKVTVDDEMGDSWIFVCDAPCGVRVDPRRTYRVMGESIVPSIPFNLAPGSGRVALQVHPTRPGTHTVGGVLAATGAIAVLGGVLLLLVDVVLHSVADGIGSESAQAQSQLNGSADTYRNIGIGFLAGGAVFGATSLLFLLAGKTDLTPAEVTPARPHADRSDGIRAIPFGFAF
jgi:hypothetical protein